MESLSDMFTIVFMKRCCAESELNLLVMLSCSMREEKVKEKRSEEKTKRIKRSSEEEQKKKG